MDPDTYSTLDMYLGHFAAQHESYVRDSRLTIHEPLTPDVAYAALRSGAFSVSGYLARWIPADPGGAYERICMTHVGAIDFDTDDGFEQAKALRLYLGSDHDVGSLLVASRRGAHLWVTGLVQGGMVPATLMRQALVGALHATGLTDDHVEVFPKSSDTNAGVGALRMPLMSHPKTGVRYPAYDPFDDQPVTRVADLIAIMGDITTSYEALQGLAALAPADRPFPPVPGLYRPPSGVRGDVPLVSEVLGRMGVPVKPGRSIKCPFHDDRHASLNVAADDQRAWCKAPTCDLYNGGYGLGSIDLAKYLTD